jgi:hypothetical protein
LIELKDLQKYSLRNSFTEFFFIQKILNFFFIQKILNFFFLIFKKIFSGPQVWPEKFPVASTGKRQSPIDINTTNCLMKNDLGDGNPLKISYPQTFSGLTIQNTGHGWKVDIPDQLAEKTCELSFVINLLEIFFHCI